MYKKILLATDGSEDSIKAAKRVVTLQKQFGSEIVFFYSENHHPIENEIQLTLPRPLFDLSVLRIPQENYQAIREALQKHAEKIIRDTQAIFEEAGVKAEGRLIMDIEPADYAKQTVKKEGFELVVAGCKGHHSRLRKALIGTVAEKISNEVDCDVLIVR